MNKVFASIIFVILFLLAIDAHEIQAEEEIEPTGTFSNMFSDKDTGDVSGYEVVIEKSGSEYSGTYRYAVGEPRPFAYIKPKIDGEMISFTFEYLRRRKKSYKGKFIGFYNEKGISGTLTHNKSRDVYKVDLIRQPKEEEALKNGWGLDEAKEWGVFVNNPNQENYFALGKLFNQCEKGNEECEKELNPHYSRSQKLVELVKLGNKKAIDIAFASLRVLGGGELGDVSRALGYVIESDPEFFLRKIRSHSISLFRIRKIVQGTPLELTDQFDLKIKVFERRLKSMSSLKLKDPFLSSYKDICIKALQRK